VWRGDIDRLHLRGRPISLFGARIRPRIVVAGEGPRRGPACESAAAFKHIGRYAAAAAFTITAPAMPRPTTPSPIGVLNSRHFWVIARGFPGRLFLKSLHSLPTTLFALHLLFLESPGRHGHHDLPHPHEGASRTTTAARHRPLHGRRRRCPAQIYACVRALAPMPFADVKSVDTQAALADQGAWSRLITMADIKAADVKKPCRSILRWRGANGGKLIMAGSARRRGRRNGCGNIGEAGSRLVLGEDRWRRRRTAQRSRRGSNTKRSTAVVDIRAAMKPGAAAGLAGGARQPSRWTGPELAANPDEMAAKGRPRR